MKIAIAGAGIAGLTLACRLAQNGIIADLYESAPKLEPIGLGINVLPHAGRALQSIGVLDGLADMSVETYESTFFNRFGQHIYSEPAGLRAGYDLPQYSVHRGDLHSLLIKRFNELAGPGHMHLSHRCTGTDQDERGVTVHLENSETAEPLPSVRADLMIAAEGIHSVIRKQLHPEEGDPIYSGVNMWRGSVVHPPFLDGANMVRIGWLATGKLVLYPIRDDVDGKGNQLINWVAELETPNYKAKRDWNKQGDIEDFIHCFADMTFDWLDVPAMLRGTETILEYPMVDQDPLPFWTQGRITLMGDAAHPMYPRGSNGACQAILDGICLGEALLANEDPLAALKAYEDQRRPATARVVLSNRTNPPDVILREVFMRTCDKPFDDISDIITQDELATLSNSYKSDAGYAHDQMASEPTKIRPTGDIR